MLTTQEVDRKLTRSSIFMTVKIDPDKRSQILELLGDISSLVRAVGFRVPKGKLSCIVGIGSDAWDVLFPDYKPAGLHPFIELHGVYNAPSTPGDILFHIRAKSYDLCFELANSIRLRLSGGAEILDVVSGFRYFDERDLLGFVDGTENPVGQAAVAATIVGDEDPVFRGGSYVITQKYIHDMQRWHSIPVSQQELIIGRKKLSDVELWDKEKPTYAHNVLNKIYDEDGNQIQILRDNMPFADVKEGVSGTFFIGYANKPDPIEQMLRNMFVGLPEGNYDRILDVSTAITGNLFFIPTSSFLDDAPKYIDGVVKPDDEALMDN